MTLPATVLELIAQDVLATIDGLSVPMPVALADGSTTFTLNAEREPQKAEPGPFRVEIKQSGGDRIDEAAQGTDEWVQQFHAVVYVLLAEDDPTGLDVYGNAIVGALHRALMEDYTRGGHALNTIVQAPVFFPPVAGEFDGLTFNFDVQYRHLLDDPFAAAT